MTKGYKDIIKLFVNGDIDLNQLSDIIDERLFNLRQNPDSMAEEQSVLSGIELLICEIKDGFRNQIELEEYAKSLLPTKPLVINWDDPGSKTPIFTSSSNRDVSLSMVTPDPAIRDYCLQTEFA